MLFFGDFSSNIRYQSLPETQFFGVNARKDEVMKKSGVVKQPKALLVSVQRPEVKDSEVVESADELQRLVETLGFVVVARFVQKRTSVSGSTVVGEGKLREIATWTGGSGVVQGYSKHTGHSGYPVQDEEDLLEELSHEKNEPTQEAHLVVFDHELTPTQARNIEQALGVDVMDRTGVIVEIFHRHAKTPAARAQVEIARLTYLTPRLRAAGGGDRQGGGIGAKGAGETQHELDRRRIRDRIAELRRDLEAIHKEEALRRERRHSSMKVALVGYTNAGKSSLMRALTGSHVLVADKLFATLDTTVRALYPESKPKILVTDTVGFIKKLPHDLVASFRSTLDEALDASLLLIVADASDSSFRTQVDTTRSVLGEIGAAERDQLLVLNKTDRLSELDKAILRKEFPDAVFISALDPESVRGLREICIAYFERSMVDSNLKVSYESGAAMAEIRRIFRVIEEHHGEDGIVFKIRGWAHDIEKLKKTYAIA